MKTIMLFRRAKPGEISGFKRRDLSSRKTLLEMTVIILVLLCASNVRADYEAELREQIRQIGSRGAAKLNFEYFHDMGIIARKADEAELTALTTEIVKTLLLKKMDEFVQAEVTAVNALYETDRYQASRRLQDLNRFRRFFQPTEDYLGTTGGQAIQNDMIRFRADAIQAFQKDCSTENIISGLQAVLKAGLFITQTPEEIKSLQALPPKVECCLSFSPEIHFQDQQDFVSTYEEGTIKIDARLKLQTSRRDYSDAKWVGDWVQHFTGRDGEGDATAQAVLKYSKGAETADLAIATSRVTSVGRMNFPVTFVGENRTLEVQGKPVAPKVVYAPGKLVLMTGCQDRKK